MPRLRRIYLAALTRYDLRKDVEHGGFDPIAPENPGVVHAHGVWGGIPRDKAPQVTHDTQAICGAKVKLLLPVEFDPGDPDACQQCAGMVHERRQRWPAAGGSSA